METCVIRAVKPQDSEALCALHGDSFGDARWSLEQINSSLALETTVGFVAENHGEACGFILFQIAEAEAEILTLCVTPALRRWGIGLRLLETALRRAKEKGSKRFFLDVAADNAGALRLYQKAGFKKTGVRPRYYARKTGPVDAVLMAMDL